MEKKSTQISNELPWTKRNTEILNRTYAQKRQLYINCKILNRVFPKSNPIYIIQIIYGVGTSDAVQIINTISTITLIRLAMALRNNELKRDINIRNL